MWEVFRPKTCGRICALHINLTPKEGSLAEWGCAEVPLYAPVQRWAVPAPKLSAEERKHAECEMDDPEGNLVIVERVVHENQCMFPQTSTVGTVVPTFLASTQDGTLHDIPSPTQDGTQT